MRLARERFGFTPDELEALSLAAVRGAFLPEAERQRLLEMFHGEFARLRDAGGLA